LLLCNHAILRHKARYMRKYTLDNALLPVQDLMTFHTLVFDYLQFSDTSLIFTIKRQAKYHVYDYEQQNTTCEMSLKNTYTTHNRFNGEYDTHPRKSRNDNIYSL